MLERVLVGDDIRAETTRVPSPRRPGRPGRRRVARAVLRGDGTRTARDPAVVFLTVCRGVHEETASPGLRLADRRARAGARAHLISWPQLQHPARAAGGLVAAVEDVGDVVDLLGARGGVAGGGPEVDVPEPSGDGV